MLSAADIIWLFVLLVLAIGEKKEPEEKKVTKSKSENIESRELVLKDITFVVISQSNSYHVKRSQEFKNHFLQQTKHLEKEDRPHLLFTSEKWGDLIGAWTVLPLLPSIAKDYQKSAWLFVCEEETRIDVTKLLSVLKKYDYKQEYFLGKGLRDREATIIHHFANANNPSVFAFPDFGAGFLMSNALFTSIGKQWPDDTVRTDFSIDPKHELALVIQNNGKGANLTEVKELCTDNVSEQCATWYPLQFPDCYKFQLKKVGIEGSHQITFHTGITDNTFISGKEISDDELIVGVKTCEKFHKERVSVVKDTWGKDSHNIQYFSDKEDLSIPTISLGIPNTERGHCGKTMAMIKRWYKSKEFSSIPWYLIADDDTIINLKRLRKLLACYNPAEPVHMGEVYGYSVSKRDWGYTYITGGGGMVFSREAIKQVVVQEQTDCHSDDAPDDMTLGMRFKRMGISLVHSPYFHQARPADYSLDFLSARTALSFHKHWNNDPKATYKDLINDRYSSKNKSKGSHGAKSKVQNTKESHEEL